MKRNLDNFVTKESDSEATLNLVNKVHNVLYKYSHQRLNYFCKVPELAYIFKYFYANGAQGEKQDIAYSEALEFINNDCSETLESNKQ